MPMSAASPPIFSRTRARPLPPCVGLPAINQSSASTARISCSARVAWARRPRPDVAAITADPSLKDDELDAKLAPKQAFAGSNVVNLRGPRPAAAAGEDLGSPGNRLGREPKTFADVGGLDDVKKDISRKIIQPFKNPSLFSKFKRKAGGGVLLYGPPGCGKTMLARATAGEVGAAFFSVEIAEVLDMFIGQSEKRLASIFENARAAKPAVLFFDEIEALAARRRFGHSDNGASMVSTFLNEMDGVNATNDGILVLAATNTPWAIDNAFRRPGRFDRVIFIPPPDREARLAILQMAMKDRPQEAVNLEPIAQATSGFSGADLVGLIEEACDFAIEESLDFRRGRAHPPEASHRGDKVPQADHAGVVEPGPELRQVFQRGRPLR